jgi:putative ABC transport system permease protein
VARSLRFAWLSLVRQPARAVLGILGVAAIGALLFDMLLLSRGLLLSFGELLGRAGFDVRVLASDSPPPRGPRLDDATALADRISRLPEIEEVLQVRLRSADLERPGGARGSVRAEVGFLGADPRGRPPWSLLEGRDLGEAGSAIHPVLVNRVLAKRAELVPGSPLSLRGQCGNDDAQPAVTFTVVGIAEFPFDSATDASAAGTLADAGRLCGQEGADEAEMLLVRAVPRAGALAAARAIRETEPAVFAVTNEDLVERFSRVEFSYFRQISTVLATITLFFGFLLVAVLLTVSVNQRLGEIAALRALGLSRSRVVSGVLWESLLLVGAGGALALPAGALLAVWLDAILRAMPGVPADLHFFVFEARALVVYGTLLAVASVAAALYPMRIVAVLPIAGTLRREVVS